MFASMLVLGGIYGAIEYALWEVGSEKLTISIGAIFESVIYMSFFLIPSWFFYAISKNKPKEDIKFKPKFHKYLPLMIVAGIGLVFTTAQLNDLFLNLIGYQYPAEDYSKYMNDGEVVALFMTLSLAPAFAEELLFRGVIYTNLRPYGKVFAILASSVLFGLMHTNVAQFFYTTVAGIMMAIIYEVTGSIWGGIFMHMFNNLYAVFQTAVLYRYDETSATVILYVSQTALIFAGLICTIALLCLKRRHDMDKREAPEPPKGFFGVDKPAKSSGLSVSFSEAVKQLCQAPGMIVFAVLSVALMLSMLAQ